MGRSKVNELISAIEAAGGTVSTTTKGHLKVMGPKGIAIIGRPGRDPHQRTLQNELTRLRNNAGLNIRFSCG